MKLTDYKTNYAISKGYDSWNELAEKYRNNGWFYRHEVILDTIAEKYAEDLLHEYKISELPPEQRRLFDVVRWEWKKTGDIAAECGKTSGNIGVQLAIMEKKGLLCSKLEPVSARKTVKFWRLKRNPDE